MLNTGIRCHQLAFKDINDVVKKSEKFEDRPFHSYYFRKQILDYIFLIINFYYHFK